MSGAAIVKVRTDVQLKLVH